MAMTITFERFTRDCPRNDDIVARGGATRDLIYDYRVLRDGEHIATFRRDGNGYELYDRIGGAVVRPDATGARTSGRSARANRPSRK